MIVLLEPPRPPGFVSGGYRYQDNLAAELRRLGLGEQHAVGGERHGADTCSVAHYMSNVDEVAPHRWLAAREANFVRT